MKPRKHSESRQRTALVALRFLPSERAALEVAAQNRAVSLSEFIRASALDAAEFTSTPSATVSVPLGDGILSETR